MMDTMIWPMTKMILALGIVCAVLFFLARLLRRSEWAKTNLPLDSGIKVLSTQLIAPQKYISLVEIGGEVLALGISETQITFLTKIEKKGWVEERKNHPPSKPEPVSLFHYLSRFPLKPKGQKMGLLERFRER
jgi:flagellar biogenesis protein FliO